MPDREKVIKGLESLHDRLLDVARQDSVIMLDVSMVANAIALLKEQDERIKKYEYLFDFLGIGFREWATKILDGEAEAICEADEHEHKTVITFKLI